MQWCRRRGIKDVGFMDQLMINQACVRKWELATLDYIYLYLEKHHKKGIILLPYNFGWATCISSILSFSNDIAYIFQETNTSTRMHSFHWILFAFCPSLSKVFIFDSLRATSDKSAYQDVVEMIKLAWARLCVEHPRKYKENLYFHYDFPVCVFC